EQGMVRRQEHLAERQREARRVSSLAQSAFDEGVRLVQREEVAHAIAEVLGQDAHVVGEPLWGIGVAEATEPLERLRRVPVKQREIRRDAAREQAVDETVVEAKSSGVDRSSS